MPDKYAVKIVDEEVKPLPATRVVTIPACEEHQGYMALTVRLPWVCIHCGQPRGEPVDALSYDGSLRMNVSDWSNPLCGHVEKYSEVRAWILANGGFEPFRP